MQLHHRHITHTLGLAAVALAIGGVASAGAQPPTTETITDTWTAGPQPTAPPYRGSGSGTFTASGPVNDAGTINIQGQETAVPSPTHGNLLIDATLTSQDGTLKLRCQPNQATNFTDPSAVPTSGQCAITGGGTGVYAQLHGHGTISSVLNLNTETAIDTIVLKVS